MKSGEITSDEGVDLSPKIIVFETMNGIHYRYPGSSPFEDNDFDRRLFFGRDKEIQKLLNLVLAENLVVLFAKSGIGKTSLLNAGIVEPLRQQGFIPLRIRFNDPQTKPFDTLYQGVETASKQQHKIELIKGETTSLWHYFKTVEFWSADSTLMTPVLILDQFEDFFASYELRDRKKFIEEFTELIRGRKVRHSAKSSYRSEKMAFSEMPPQIKTIISLREDYLYLLEELASNIPTIFQNRFKLLPMNLEQAQEAIEEPAKLKDSQFKTEPFTYTEETLNLLLNYLGKQRRLHEVSSTQQIPDRSFQSYLRRLQIFKKPSSKYSTKIVPIDEIEPSQLQLFCRHVEEVVMPGKQTNGGKEVIIANNDFGGEQGLKRIFQNFYKRQIKQVSFWRQGRVRRLCEDGLISSSNRRLPLEVQEIKHRFKLSKKVLSQLVRGRLLRAEPRLGSVYYELSHDTLVEPIKQAQKRRNNIKNFILMGMMAFIAILISILSEPLLIQYLKPFLIENKEELTPIVSLSQFNKFCYIRGREFSREKQSRTAIDYLEIASEFGLDSHQHRNHLYRQMAINYSNIKEYYKANECLTKVSPFDAWEQNFQGVIFYKQKEYNKAILSFKDACEKLERHIACSNLGFVYKDKQGHLNLTLTQKRQMEGSSYLKAFLLATEESKYLRELLDYLKKNYQRSEKLEGLLLRIHANPALIGTELLTDLGYEFIEIGDYNNAIIPLEKAIEPYDKYADTRKKLKKTLEGQFIEIGDYDNANTSSEETIESDDKYADAYNNLGRAYYHQKNYRKAVEYYQYAIALDPQNYIFYGNLGYTFLAQKKYDDAIQRFKRAIELNKKYANAHNGWGQVLFEQNHNDGDDAIEKYTTAIEIAPNYANAHKNLGIALIKKELYEEAFRHLDEATRILAKKWTSPDPEIYHYQGIIFFEKFQYENAIERFEKAIELSENSTAQRGQDFHQFADTYFHLGMLLKEKKPSDAEAFLRKAIQTKPSYREAYSELGDIFYKQRRYKESLEQFQSAIKLSVQPSASLYYKLGLNYWALENDNKAFDAFSKVVQLNPENAGAYYYLGKLYELDAQPYKATFNILKAFLLEPENLQFYQELNKGFSELTRMKRNSIQKLLEAVKTPPHLNEQYYNLGREFYEQELYDYAREVLEKSSKEGYQSHELYIRLAYIAQLNEEDEELFLNYLKAFLIAPAKYEQFPKFIEAFLNYEGGVASSYIIQHPGNASYYYQLGGQFYAYGRYEAALECYLKGLEINPGDIEAKRALSEFYLLTSRFDDALTSAKSVLSRRQSWPDYRELAMRFIIISSLIFQGEKREPLQREVYDFIQAHETSVDDSGEWGYDKIDNFIKNTDKIEDSDRKMLLELIKILKAQKFEANIMLEQFIIQFNAWFQQISGYSLE